VSSETGLATSVNSSPPPSDAVYTNMVTILDRFATRNCTILLTLLETRPAKQWLAKHLSSRLRGRGLLASYPHPMFNFRVASL
jgi:hypothetical protein